MVFEYNLVMPACIYSPENLSRLLPDSLRRKDRCLVCQTVPNLATGRWLRPVANVPLVNAFRSVHRCIVAGGDPGYTTRTCFPLHGTPVCRAPRPDGSSTAVQRAGLAVRSKYDGFRGTFYLTRQDCGMYSTRAQPLRPIPGALRPSPVEFGQREVILDGEVIAFDLEGQIKFWELIISRPPGTR